MRARRHGFFRSFCLPRSLFDLKFKAVWKFVFASLFVIRGCAKQIIRAVWYFEIDHENMILSPKLPEVPPR